MQADVPAWAPEGREGRSQEAIGDQGRPWQIKAFWNPRCYQHLRCLYYCHLIEFKLTKFCHIISFTIGKLYLKFWSKTHLWRLSNSLKRIFWRGTYLGAAHCKYELTQNFAFELSAIFSQMYTASMYALTWYQGLLDLINLTKCKFQQRSCVHHIVSHGSSGSTGVMTQCSHFLIKMRTLLDNCNICTELSFY